MIDLKKGDVVKSSKWTEAVEINLIEKMGEFIRIIGATIISKKHIDQLISNKEYEDLSLSQRNNLFGEEAWKVFLALETIRYNYASLYDPLLAMNTSKVDPLPHQIEAVYGYVLKLPRIRFLIADDPGAGKTIMAGLIIKELKLRHLVKRILIVAPGHLKDQWRRELSERFDEKFVVIDKGIMGALYGENVWLRENQIITSIDFLKREEILPSIASIQFDLIVVDEAHKMSAYKYGDKTDKTSRYKLGETLSRITEHLLFLTATPHRGDPENFRLFLDLLEPGFFATNEMINQSILNKNNPLFIRRVKEDLRDFEGKPLYVPRNVKTLSFELGILSPKEKDLYNMLSVYVETQYNKSLQKDKKRNIGFALIILQRRLASSTYALYRSLERRKNKLLDILNGNPVKQKSQVNFDMDEEYDDMDENERWKEEENWETISASENREEVKEEIKTLDELIERAKDIIVNEDEIKLKELKKTLVDLIDKYNDKNDKKILIFTESRDTLEHLEAKIREWGYKTNTIHGGMNLEDRIKAEKIFKNETEILIATEAAGEGINLQFCHLMLNFDIPWNPNRLEQRMGRIHRYGQQKEVFIYNLVAKDTREGKVLNRLFEKLEEIKNALGNDKVFDVLGEVLVDKNLSQLLIDAASNSRSVDEILKDLDFKIDEEYISNVKTNLGESLATKFIDYNRIKEMADKARESKLIPEYTENFFKKAFNKLGGKIKDKDDKNNFLSIESIPFEIRKIADLDSIKRCYGEILKKYPKVSFDKEISFKNPEIEFISFGHPLFESLLKYIEINYYETIQNGAVFIDPDGEKDGYILFYEGEVKDGTDSIVGKRLFAYYIDKRGSIEVNPSIIWDIEEGHPQNNQEHVDIEEYKKAITNLVIISLEGYKNYLIEERERQTEIKEKYGYKSLEYLILKLDGELIELYTRKDKGENVDLAIRNKEERKNEYEKSLTNLKELISREKNLTMNMPTFRGIIRIISNKDKKDGKMHSSEEIEMIGMNYVMDYEEKEGRKAEDVSMENLGFDIRSNDDKNGETRYIEVKARSTIGEVALTKNEWFKAQRFGNKYYLYVVYNANSNPELHIIKNPAESIKADEKVEIVRYIVSYDNIIKNKNI